MSMPAESTTVGKSVTIQGEVSGSEDLFLDGSLEGSIRLTGHRLTIGPNARVKGDLEAQQVVIHGRVSGNVRAAGKVELRDSSVMQGDITAGRLSIEDEASYKGKVDLAEAAGSGAQASANENAAED